jgi:hypothetical protein
VIVIAPPVAHYNPIVPSRTLLFCIPGSSLFFSVLRLQEFVEKMLTAVSAFLVDAADRAWAVAERSYERIMVKIVTLNTENTE